MSYYTLYGVKQIIKCWKKWRGLFYIYIYIYIYIHILLTFYSCCSWLYGWVEYKRTKIKVRSNPHTVSNIIYLYIYKELLSKMKVCTHHGHKATDWTTVQSRFGLVPGRAKRFLAAPEHPDALWDHSSFCRIVPGIK